MFWDHRCLGRIDFRILPLLLGIMLASLFVISATTGEEGFWTETCKSQLRWFILGWAIFFFVCGFDYRKLRDWAWILYIVTIILLVGLFFVPAIQNVHRWYRIPFLGMAVQPSECAKLVVVIALSWFLENRAAEIRQSRATWQSLLIVLIPFLLILKQPDLDSALVLYPVVLIMFFFGGIKKRVVATMAALAFAGLAFVTMMFLGVLSHDGLRPYFTKVIKEYQYERFSPNTYHQKAAQTAIALGGMTGSGWHKSEFTGRQWLPAAHTDSVFAAFAEEFGFVGVFLLMLFFFGLIYFSFQVTAVAKDRFGRLLSAGITVYLAVHILVNMGMMCGFLPITGTPLLLVTYGGSSVVMTMTALGILQSIYSRRFMFT